MPQSRQFAIENTASCHSHVLHEKREHIYYILSYSYTVSDGSPRSYSTKKLKVQQGAFYLIFFI